MLRLIQWRLKVVHNQGLLFQSTFSSAAILFSKTHAFSLQSLLHIIHSRDLHVAYTELVKLVQKSFTVQLPFVHYMVIVP